jgi:hyaluronan synthase
MRLVDRPQASAAGHAANWNGALPRASVLHVEPTAAWTYTIYALILAGFAVTAYFQLHAIVWQLLAVTAEHERARILLYPSLLWMAMGSALLLFRTGIWIAYRPFAAQTRDAAPRLTVIIPAYNEGAMVLQSIESVAKADYPRERLEILVIDDGSKDDTWRYISEAAARYPGLVTALRHERNRGKREALALGFARARGEILVTLDSDSVIEPGALLALAGPFRDPRVGAVAGKVLVYNREHGIIPRMLHVRYVLSFDMLRSVESVYRNVYCCPGALTGLRAAAVRGVLERWKNQRFLGARCTFGEDRAMTNFLLDSGYDTVYQRAAVVHTVVPTVYPKLCKMLLRWDRSYVREEIRFARILWKRPAVTRIIAFFDRFITNARFPVFYASLGLVPFLGARDPAIFLRMLTAMGLVSLVNMLYYLRSERSFDFLYGVLYAYFSSFTLFWIFPYAVMTVRARGWLTR